MKPIKLSKLSQAPKKKRSRLPGERHPFRKHEVKTHHPPIRHEVKAIGPDKIEQNRKESALQTIFTEFELTDQTLFNKLLHWEKS